jgi:hypothetical protein
MRLLTTCSMRSRLRPTIVEEDKNWLLPAHSSRYVQSRTRRKPISPDISKQIWGIGPSPNARKAEPAVAGLHLHARQIGELMRRWARARGGAWRRPESVGTAASATSSPHQRGRVEGSGEAPLLWLVRLGRSGGRFVRCPCSGVRDSRATLIRIPCSWHVRLFEFNRV